jgi:ubiquinone/menaquinone biosynthesis C-methylase UbiE
LSLPSPRLATQGDAENMPFPDKHFDVVACRFAMHQIQYPLDVIEEMFRVCKPGGKVVC